jgi:hypothetical protein
MMSDLPTREEAVTWIINPRGERDIDALLGAYVDGVLLTAAEWRDSLTQIGWFDPGSKRFCYTDTKEVHPESNAGHTIPVFAALGEQP